MFVVLDVKQELFLAVRSVIKYKTIAHIFILIPVSNSLVLYLQELKPDNRKQTHIQDAFCVAVAWHGRAVLCLFRPTCPVLSGELC